MSGLSSKLGRLAPVDDRRLERLCATILILAGLASVTLLLWLNRGTVFFVDEIAWFSELGRGNGIGWILEPHNSHLIGTTRLLFLSVSELAGPDYVVLRVVAALSVLLCSCVFYVWARRRIGPAWALLPSALLLFYGSAWQHVVVPIGFTITFSIALGLLALISLEREDRRGDVLACTLVSLSVFTYTVGLGYLVGVAVAVLLRGDRLKRLWIFLIPLLLYAAWWLWSQHFDQTRTTATNLLDVGQFFARSLAIDGGGLTGVNIPWSRLGTTDPVTVASASPLGWAVGAGLVVAVAWRIRRGDVKPSIYVSLAVLATFWLSAALADTEFTQVDAVRYLYPGSIALLLVLTDAAQGLRVRASWGAAILAVFAFSFAMNLVFLRDGAAYERSQANTTLINLAMLELGNGRDPGAGPLDSSPVGPKPSYGTPPLPYIQDGDNRLEYLAAIAEYGSPAYDIDQIRALPAADRLAADVSLQKTDFNLLIPSEAPTDRQDCVTTRGSDGPFDLPAGGASMRPAGRVCPWG